MENCSFVKQDNLKTFEYSYFNIDTKGQPDYKTSSNISQ